MNSSSMVDANLDGLRIQAIDMTGPSSIDTSFDAFRRSIRVGRTDRPSHGMMKAAAAWLYPTPEPTITSRSPERIFFFATASSRAIGMHADPV